MIGMAARVMETTPKKFVSIKARNLSELTCSNGAVSPYPALLTKTSNRPKTSTALATAAFAATSSATSRGAYTLVRHTALQNRSIAADREPLPAVDHPIRELPLRFRGLNHLRSLLPTILWTSEPPLRIFANSIESLGAGSMNWPARAQLAMDC
jgi:hypothetical protein